MAGFRALPFRDELASSSIGSPPPAYPGDDQISSTPGKQRSNSQETTLNKFGLCNRSPPTARYITFYVIIYLCPMVLFITRVMLLSRGLQYFFSTVVQRLKMSHFIWNVLHSTAFYFHRGVFDDSVLDSDVRGRYLSRYMGCMCDTVPSHFGRVANTVASNCLDPNDILIFFCSI